MKISELKKEAIAKLAGKWPLAILINLTQLIISLVITYAATKIEGILGIILSVVGVIISIPLSYGLATSMLKLSRNETVGVTDFITIGFQNFKKAFLLSLSIFIRIIIPSILFTVALAFSIIMGLANALGASASGDGIISFVAIIVAVASMIWLVYKILSYAFSTYILIDNEDMKSKEAIARSCELMKGNKLKFVGLVFSFFGWLLLSGILAGIVEAFNATLGLVAMYGLSLILTPYITFAEINFYEDLAGISEVKVGTVEDTIVE